MSLFFSFGSELKIFSQVILFIQLNVQLFFFFLIYKYFVIQRETKLVL